MLHARDDFLADKAALLEIDPVQLVEQRLMREGVAEGIVARRLRARRARCARRDSPARSRPRSRAAPDRAASAGTAREPSSAQPRIGIDDGAVGRVGGRRPKRPPPSAPAPRRSRPRPEPVETEPFHKLGRPCRAPHRRGSRRPRPRRRNRTGSCPAARAGRHGWRGPLRLADIVGDQALQEFARVGAADPEHARDGKQARMTMAHIRSFCYQGFRHLWERARPRKRSPWPRPSILSSKAEPSSIMLAKG